MWVFDPITEAWSTTTDAPDEVGVTVMDVMVFDLAEHPSNLWKLASSCIGFEGHAATH